MYTDDQWAMTTEGDLLCYDSDIDGTGVGGYKIVERGSNYEIMLYTGLKDINDKEIFEGDIVRQKFGNRELVGAIIFNHAKAQFGFETIIESKSEIPGNHIEVHTRPEVIGNIYENRELLKKE